MKALALVDYIQLNKLIRASWRTVEFLNKETENLHGFNDSYHKALIVALKRESNKLQNTVELIDDDSGGYCG